MNVPAALAASSPAAAIPSTVAALAPASTPAITPSQLCWATGGVALFGFALRTSAEKAAPDLHHLAWSMALPGALLLAWVVCLPALYILWAAKQPHVMAAHCIQAAAQALRTAGACMASTAPVLWFFSVTAPESRLLAPLGWAFTALALAASGAVFGASLRRGGAKLRVSTQLAFIALVTATFIQFGHAAGLHWF
jgi:hypothetical protein